MFRKPNMLLFSLFAFLFLVGCSSGQVAAIPVTTTVQGTAQELKLEAFIYKPAGNGKFPVVIFNHGSSGGDPKRSLTSKTLAGYFVDRGFVVIVPMRRGFGKSEGVSLESEERNCDVQSWWPGLHASFEDITATINYVKELPYADPSQIILAGVSRGGFLSVAYAAKGQKKAELVGVINFVGGWVAQAEDNCPMDFNYVSFSEFGRQIKIPTLWLYGENDTFYSLSSTQSYPKVFRDSGGQVRFELIRDMPHNGHWLPEYPKLWSGIVDEYLASIELKRP